MTRPIAINSSVSPHPYSVDEGSTSSPTSLPIDGQKKSSDHYRLMQSPRKINHLSVNINDSCAAGQYQASLISKLIKSRGPLEKRIMQRRLAKTSHNYSHPSSFSDLSMSSTEFDFAFGTPTNDQTRRSSLSPSERRHLFTVPPQCW